MKISFLQMITAMLCSASAVAFAAAPTGATAREYIEATLLLSDRDLDLRLGLKSLRRQSVKSEPLFDLAAELTWLACSGKRRMNPDTLAWFAKIIGESKQGRYTRLIDDCLAKVTEKGAVKYFTVAKEALAETATVNPFVGGNMDLDQVREQIAKNRKANPPAPEMKTRFESLQSGQRLDEVYSKLGAPGWISGVRIPRGQAGFMYVKVRLGEDRVVLHYPEQGDAHFGYDEGSGDWLLVDARSDNGLLWVSRRGRLGTLNDLVANGDAHELRKVTKLVSSRPNLADAALHDRIADRIYFSQTETNGEMADALAHMCKLLTRSRDGKYKPLLREVAENAAHRTVRKYAGQAADALPDPVEAKYIAKIIAD